VNRLWVPIAGAIKLLFQEQQIARQFLDIRWIFQNSMHRLRQAGWLNLQELPNAFETAVGVNRLP
jgi:hypothetical protein